MSTSSRPVISSTTRGVPLQPRRLRNKSGGTTQRSATSPTDRSRGLRHSKSCASLTCKTSAQQKLQPPVTPGFHLPTTMHGGPLTPQQRQEEQSPPLPLTASMLGDLADSLQTPKSYAGAFAFSAPSARPAVPALIRHTTPLTPKVGKARNRADMQSESAWAVANDESDQRLLPEDMSGPEAFQCFVGQWQQHEQYEDPKVLTANAAAAAAKKKHMTQAELMFKRCSFLYAKEAVANVNTSKTAPSTPVPVTAKKKNASAATASAAGQARYIAGPKHLQDLQRLRRAVQALDREYATFMTRRQEEQDTVATEPRKKMPQSMVKRKPVPIVYEFDGKKTKGSASGTAPAEAARLAHIQSADNMGAVLDRAFCSLTAFMHQLEVIEPPTPVDATHAHANRKAEAGAEAHVLTIIPSIADHTGAADEEEDCPLSAIGAIHATPLPGNLSAAGTNLYLEESSSDNENGCGYTTARAASSAPHTPTHRRTQSDSRSVQDKRRARRTVVCHGHSQSLGSSFDFANLLGQALAGDVVAADSIGAHNVNALPHLVQAPPRSPMPTTASAAALTPRANDFACDRTPIAASYGAVLVQQPCLSSGPPRLDSIQITPIAEMFFDGESWGSSTSLASPEANKASHARAADVGSPHRYDSARFDCGASDSMVSDGEGYSLGAFKWETDSDDGSISSIDSVRTLDDDASTDNCTSTSLAAGAALPPLPWFRKHSHSRSDGVSAADKQQTALDLLIAQFGLPEDRKLKTRPPPALRLASSSSSLAASTATVGGAASRHLHQQSADALVHHRVLPAELPVTPLTAKQQVARRYY
ncbi:hypothetical protein K437DRAFT_254583 [Tilletiaria anomala UBC 951]|uniref:Uncharacterized protein n=1 Tax=Tilletiaria anomala (strain ATCC 24038 / CBS 436.72 / UBC 951) TaxID=1037660 RepID=A0A066WI39_TILAU|nr:uncharacterized protein K437DRAFT_254583 [Tilletiaria anomala UBC 951]KDN52198.1 hypothetical protein K437DRAFT_254583 [Tilletiaria anomala UBC 951]